jgi:DNA-damage-inducible protein J
LYFIIYDTDRKEIKVAQASGIPFDVRLPNKTTRKVVEDLEKGKNVKRFDNAEELFEDLGI